MHLPRHLLAQYKSADEKRFQERWFREGGHQATEHVVRLANERTGEDFLYGEDVSGPLAGFIEDELDLRGFPFPHEATIVFPDSEAFENIYFDYARANKNTFVDGCFSSRFNFCDFRDCRFLRCAFYLGSRLGCLFERCTFTECDFVLRADFLSCEFRECEFESYTTDHVLFRDCKLDSGTHIAEPGRERFGSMEGRQPQLHARSFSTFYWELEAGYLLGGAPTLARHCHYLSRQAFGKHNARTAWTKLGNLVNRRMAGYGVRPLAPIGFAAKLALLFSAFFLPSQVVSLPFSRSEALFDVVSSLFFSFMVMIGAADISHLEGALFAIAALEKLVGLIMLPIFITVLANVWFRYRE